MYSEKHAVESRLIELFGLNRVVCFGRARSALVCLIELLYPDRRANIILPSNICPSLVAAVVAASAKPVLAAVDPKTGLTNSESCQEAMERCDRPGLLMLAHLYGFDGQYDEITRKAKEAGWFVLESDVCGVRIATESTTNADALLVSFGSGKVIDGGVGGAVLVNDIELAGELQERCSTYPVLSELSIQNESYLNGLRRILTHGMPSGEVLAGLYEEVLPYEISDIRHRLPEASYKDILFALNGFYENRQRRIERALDWKDCLNGIADDVFVISELSQPAPWRFIVRLPKHRDALVTQLRANKIDVGTNYPCLKHYFPRLLAENNLPQSIQWQNEVVNFWVTDDYDLQKIAEVASQVDEFFNLPKFSENLATL